ncbi:phosphotransferase [Marininema halotolerans]|uniref:Spore coat protein, CotS family n=1 Tax=Marininema halotolerans TaxID=1155944 RepID=A0A1I6R158_9BACL|nr:phosphotransferase [Marininema halotolerans]SFS58436.1 spore coat protein, CotS family [Marininema halotolerans]
MKRRVALGKESNEKREKIPSADMKNEWETTLGLTIHEVKPYYRNWLLVTPKGKWVAKKIHHPQQLQWWIRIDRELRQKGFHQMPLICTDERDWLFTSWVEGRRATYKNRKDIMIVADLLGRFHTLGKGLAMSELGIYRNNLLQRVQSRFHSFTTLLDSPREWQSAQGEMKQFANQFHWYGREAMQQLLHLPLDELCEWDRRTHSITHRDLASHNILLSNDETPWLIDFETAAFDSQVGDIWQLLSRGLSEQRWDRCVAEEALAAYEVHRPLTALEKKVLIVLLSFPNEFYREFLGLTLAKEGYGKDKTLPYLEQMAMDIPRWRRFLKEIETW